MVIAKQLGGCNVFDVFTVQNFSLIMFNTRKKLSTKSKYFHESYNNCLSIIPVLYTKIDEIEMGSMEHLHSYNNRVVCKIDGRVTSFDVRLKIRKKKDRYEYIRKNAGS